MRFNLMLITLLFISHLGLSQVINFQDLGRYEDVPTKGKTYITSRNDTFNVGDEIHFSNYDINSSVTPFLTEFLGNKLLTYADLADMKMRLHNVKVIENRGKQEVRVTVIDEKTTFRYKLNMEYAIDLGQLTKHKIEEPHLLTSATQRRPTMPDSLSPQNKATSSSVNNRQRQEDLLPRLPTPNINNDVSKEMLYMSALEMKRFTRGYNRSLLLTVGGSVMTGLVTADLGSGDDLPPLGYLGIMMIIGGAVQGIYARQHVGRSGAYLEAYANGVRIRF